MFLGQVACYQPVERSVLAMPVTAMIARLVRTATSPLFGQRREQWRHLRLGEESLDLDLVKGQIMAE